MVLFECPRRLRHRVTASTSAMGDFEHTVIRHHDIRPDLLDFCLAHLLRLAEKMDENVASHYYCLSRDSVGV